jgi:hypothetical protein
MSILDVLTLTFSAVAVNHLGLVAAIERTVKHRLPIIDCPKCLTFWTAIGYGTLSGLEHPVDIIGVCAVALLAAWAAVWLELLMGFTDRLYLRAYEQIYPTADSADADTQRPRDAVSRVRKHAGADGSKKAAGG